MIVALLAAASSMTLEDIHPGFVKEPKILEQAWEAGLREGGGKRPDPFKLHMKFKRGIGSIRTSAFRSETVSWLFLVTPESSTFHTACDAKHKLLPSSKVAELKAATTTARPIVQTTQIVGGLIQLHPSFGGRGGQIDREADPSHLQDVRIVMRVGDRNYEPREQPGNLLQNQGTGSSTYSVPGYVYEESKSQTAASVITPSGTLYGSSTTSGAAIRTFNTINTETYRYYQGSFIAHFDLFEPDGKPRITKADKKVEFVVIYGPVKAAAGYSLSDFVKQL